MKHIILRCNKCVRPSFPLLYNTPTNHIQTSNIMRIAQRLKNNRNVR
jgi:hypothetical protein